MRMKDEYVLTELGNEFTAVPIGQAAEAFHGIIRLNETGAFIWRALSEGMSVEQLAEKMLKEYDGLSIEKAEESICSFIEKLRSEGILEE